ncbi:MAG TPA: type I-C CRISPR-associated protein Cas5 [Phycisphaerales bacterium]|nr:type I-C CRISPR-associated protein Cas5 [Phycisphaerales bacterium]
MSTKPLRVHVWSDLALFTRPEMKVERVSYDAPTPSAARGVLEAIYWKPQVRWVVERIIVLNPIRYLSVRRNEVGSKIPAGSVSRAMASGVGALGLFVEDERQQRASTFLRDVAYIFEARIEVLDPSERDGTRMTPQAALAKHADCFNRRLERGQCFHRPYLGTRECACDFAPAPDPIPARPEELRGKRDLGFMLHDIDFDNNMTPRLFRATMEDGVIEVPSFHGPEVRS